ncbi:MAG: PAS domain S-box protein [Bacteroidota bacterium]
MMKYRIFLPKVTSRNRRKALAILIIGLVLTAASSFYIERNLELQSKHELALISNEIKTKIATRLHAYAQVLRDGSSLFAANDTVTRNEWKAFIEHSKLNRNLPGIQGVGFSFIIQKEQLQRHIQNIRNEGFSDYTVKPAGDREVYTSIIYLEPFTDRNLRAFGFDMFSEHIRRKAMEQARDFDVAALSGKVFLVQETDKDLQAGTLMYVPVYRNGLPTNTVGERRAAIIGWVYIPYRMHDLMDGILGSRDSIYNNRIHLQVYDNDRIDSNLLLFDSQINDTINQNNLSTRSVRIPIEFNEKKWTLLFSQPKERFSYFQSKVLIVWFSGIAISFLLFSLSLSLFNTRYRAQQMAGQMMSELKESEEKYRMLIENSHDIMYTLTADGIFIFVSQAWTAILGHPVNQVSGQPFRQFVHPDDLPGWFVFLQKVIASGQRQEGVEYRVRHTDGTWHWHTSSAVPLRDEAGIIIGFEGTARDITERKLAEDLLKQTRRNYETFFNTIDEFLFVLDERGNIIHTNTTVIDRLGYTWDELSGKSVLTVHPPDRRDEAARIVGEMLAGVSAFCPVPIVTKSGIQIPVETKVSHGFWDGKPAIFGVTKDISKIRLSEEKFSKLFHLNPSACGLSDLDTHQYIEVNEAFYTLLGFDKKEVIGKTATDLGVLTPEAINAIMMKARNNGNITNEETDLRAKNGDIKHVLISAENIHVQDKKYRFTVIHDITGQKRIEKALQESSNKFEAIISASPDGVGLVSLDGKIQLMSKKLVSMYGYSIEETDELLGKVIFDFIDPSNHKMLIDNINKLIAGEKGDKVTEYLAVKKDNSRFNVDVNSTVLLDSCGNPESILFVERDITERRQIEEILLNERLLLRTVIDNIPDHIYFKDLDSRFFRNNKAHTHSFGTSDPEFLKNKSDFDFFVKDIAQKQYDDEQEIIRTGQSINKEEFTVRNDGSTNWYYSTKMPLRNKDGVIVGTFGISRDITDRKLAEKEIVRKNRELQFLNAEKDKFFSIIAHDMRSPFNSFLGFTRIMVEELNTMSLEEIRTIVVSMRKSATNLYSLLENLLEWSMMQRGQIAYTPVSIPLALKIKESIEIIMGSVQKKEIKISYNIPDGLSVFADLHMVESLIRNLISNAIKFTSKGGIISVSAHYMKGNFIEIAIDDTGIGMNKDLIDRLFKLDEQTGRKGTEGEPTTGLGLIICMDFVEKHGGKLWVESEVGKGSTFYFTLPTTLMPTYGEHQSNEI